MSVVVTIIVNEVKDVDALRRELFEFQIRSGVVDGITVEEIHD